MTTLRFAETKGLPPPGPPSTSTRRVVEGGPQRVCIMQVQLGSASYRYRHPALPVPPDGGGSGRDSTACPPSATREAWVARARHYTTLHVYNNTA